jgi:hypothetical protein
MPATHRTKYYLPAARSRKIVQPNLLQGVPEACMESKIKELNTIHDVPARETVGRETILRFRMQFQAAAYAALEILSGKEVDCVDCDYSTWQTFCTDWKTCAPPRMPRCFSPLLSIGTLLQAKTLNGYLSTLARSIQCILEYPALVTKCAYSAQKSGSFPPNRVYPVALD